MGEIITAELGVVIKMISVCSATEHLGELLLLLSELGRSKQPDGRLRIFHRHLCIFSRSFELGRLGFVVAGQ